jgi:hypothetical protein
MSAGALQWLRQTTPASGVEDFQNGPVPTTPSELSSGDLASLLHMLDALVAKNRLKTLAGAP